MDGALSSSRNYDNNGSRSSHYQGRDNHGGYRGGGRRYNRGRGRGGGRRHQPYHRGGGRGGGRRYHSNSYSHSNSNRQPSNRFDNNSVTSVDPQTAMLKQLNSLVSKMGDLIECAKNAASGVGSTFSASTDDTSEMEGTRPVVKAVAANIQDLVVVLCSAQNAPMFLKFTPPAASGGTDMGDGGDNNDDGMVINSAEKIKADEEAGPLATLITSCAATLPLQSPSYVGLTLGVEEHAPDLIEGAQVTSYKGFAKRCITMSCRRLSGDLDKTCGVTSLLDSAPNSSSEGDETFSGDTFADAFIRTKLLLRYFALLARAGILSAFNESTDSPDVQMKNGTPSDLTLAGLLRLLTTAALKANEASSLENSSKAASNSFKNTATILCALVLSTIPYTMQSLPQSFLDYLLGEIGSILASYQSSFQPGVGPTAILLEKEIHEESFMKVEEHGSDDDEEDEEDDDDDNDSSPACADTLQDLLRTVRKLIESFYQSSNMPTRFALLSDSPWLNLKGKEQEYAPMEGDEEDAMLRQRQEALRLEYSGEAIVISLENCVVLSYLLNLEGSSSVNDIMVNGASLSNTVALQTPSLEGTIFGRISIFDPPPEEDEDIDDEDQPENPQVGAYVKTFSLLDRYFLSESVRDCLICHKSSISSSGLEKGSCKGVAEQLWGVCHLFQPMKYGSENMEDDDQSNLASAATKGVEYGIVETILSLIIQAPRNIDSTSPLRHIYLSRVLIELTKFQPSLVPQSLVVAVAALFNDFLPSMSPLAKENMSQWLSFHLTNTNYQWPQAYWNVWAPYVVQGMSPTSKGSQILKRNCRGEFVTSTIQYMASNLSNPDLIVKECLPAQNELCNYITGSSRISEGTRLSSIEVIEQHLTDRIWVENEDPESIRKYIIGDEVSESVQNDIDNVDGSANDDVTWWRTGVIVRSLLRSASRDRQRIDQLIRESQSGIDLDPTSLEYDFDPKEDVLTDIGDILPRYKTVILATVAQDIKVHEETLDLHGETKKSESDMILSGEMYILYQCEILLSYSSVILKSCIDSFVDQEIVSPKAVISWSIGNHEDKLESSNPIVSGWWNYASSAVLLGLDKFMSHYGSNVEMLATDVGMIIDTGGDDDGAKSATPSTRRMQKAIDCIKPLMRYTSSRVRKVLEAGDESAKLSHEGADLKEGLKHFTRSLSSHVKAKLKQDPIVQATTELGGAGLEVETFLANNDF